MNEPTWKHIFFLGIGGIGMSALARFFRHEGIRVSGYDRTETSLTRALTREGIAVTYSEGDPLPADTDLVVYTPAIPSAHPVFSACVARGIPLKKRAEVLGDISRHYYCMAVAGTHGKTTTSAILTHLLRCGGVEVSAFLGGIPANYGTNFLQGASSEVVVEADEYDRSFLHLHPSLLILNALDPDHLDIYGDAASMRQAYFQLIRQVMPGGIVLYRNELDIPDSVWQGQDVRVFTFGDGEADFVVSGISHAGPVVEFDLHHEGRAYRQLRFTLPGRNNVMNAAAAFAAGLLSGAHEEGMREGMRSFKGVDRRFQVHFDEGGMTYVDDYAHHPAEIAGLLEAARQRFPGRTITAIFQPHLFSRTRDFAHEFAAVLDRFDRPVLTDIYPARELPIPGVDTRWLMSLMKHPDRQYVPRSELTRYIARHPVDVLLTVGAGDVDQLIPEILQMLKAKR